MRNRIDGVVEASRVPSFLVSDKVIASLDQKEGSNDTIVKSEVKDDTPKTEAMVDHGFGVMEAHNGDIWYSENGFIYKNATNSEDRVVQRWRSKDQ